MKYLSIILSFVAASNAAWCNHGWGKPSGASCYTGYTNTYCCESPGSKHGSFQEERPCFDPHANGRPVLQSCEGSG
nr:uncharacterized protein CTRU02_03442 [Colletotrichum truncatum]KAF6797411.1 hypothetical protein CTRU02_03442 [Colletotrichum truncatum]